MPQMLQELAGGAVPVMPVEALALFVAAVLGLAQRALPGEAGKIVTRNFAETFPLFVALVALLWLMGGFGEYSAKGAVLYIVGRVAYVALTPRKLRPFRRWAWALSVAGLFGLALEAVLTAL